MQRPFNIFKATRDAINGLLIFFRTEPNGLIELIISAAVIALSVILKISAVEWILVTGCITLVIGLEMINTAIEKLCDLVEPGIHPVIKKVKDISAGAVLWVCAGSVVTGLIIFLPKIF